VVADAVHTISDCSTDVAILVGVRYWTKPPDAEHPHGHRRIETLVTIGIAALLAGVGLGLAFTALVRLSRDTTEVPEWIALGAALVSIITKEALYRWNVRVGRRIRSTALVANAWHHRSDALSSLPVAVAVAAAAIHPAWAFLDSVGAIIVSVFILKAAWGLGRPALGELVDTGAPREQRGQIERIVRATEGVASVHAIRTRYSGPGLHVDLHIQVDGDLTVREGHHIAGRVKHRLLAEGPDIIDVVVHIEPDDPEHCEPSASP
jgi:cation diffusion facilitator family transporter